MSYKHHEDGMGWGGLVPSRQEREEEKLHIQIKALRAQLAERDAQLVAEREAAKRWQNIAQHLYYALGAVKYPLNNLVNGYKGEFEQHYKLKCALVDEALEMAKKFEQSLEEANSPAHH